MVGKMSYLLYSILFLVSMLAIGCKTWSYVQKDDSGVTDRSMLNSDGQFQGAFERKCGKHIVTKGQHRNGLRVGVWEFNQHDRMIYKYDYNKDELLDVEVPSFWHQSVYDELRDTFSSVSVQRPSFCIGDRHDLGQELFSEELACLEEPGPGGYDCKDCGALKFKILIERNRQEIGH